MHPSGSALNNAHDMKALIRSYHPLIVIETVEEERVTELLRTAASELNLPLFDWTVSKGLVRPPATSAVYGTAVPLQLVRHLAGMTLEAVFHLKDFAVHLTDPVLTREFRELSHAFGKHRSSIVLTGESIQLPGEIEAAAVFFALQLPGREELREAVGNVIQSLREGHNIQISLRPDDLEPLLNSLSGLTLNQARQAVAYVALHDGRLSSDDLPQILERKAQLVQSSGLLEYFPARDNRFQLGGFARLQAWLERARVGFSPEARRMNLDPPRGILIVGVQGCGKSLAAKVIARQWQLPLLKLDAGRLYEKYIGESEKNLRKVISLAESMAPVVLWIDEIEKGMASHGSGEADAGLSRRLQATFLTWLQERRSHVFIVATANDLNVLPPEFLRKGRFDEIFFVDLPDTAEREAIFRIHLSIRNQDPALFDVAHLARASDGFSGAEIEQAVVASLYASLHARKPLETETVLQEIRSTVPLSVSRREEIEILRRTAGGRFVSVR